MRRLTITEDLEAQSRPDGFSLERVGRSRVDALNLAQAVEFKSLGKPRLPIHARVRVRFTGVSSSRSARSSVRTTSMAEKGLTM